MQMETHVKDRHVPSNSNSSMLLVTHLKNVEKLIEKGVVTKEEFLMFHVIQLMMTLLLEYTNTKITSKREDESEVTHFNHKKY